MTLTSKLRTQKLTTTYANGNQGPGWDRHKNVAGVKQIDGIPFLYYIFMLSLQRNHNINMNLHDEVVGLRVWCLMPL